MLNTKRIVCVLVAVIAVAAVSLGAFFALAGSDDYEIDIDYVSSLERWVDLGIIPRTVISGYEQSDDAFAFITYNQFAQIMQNLMHYTICERYTHLSGDMYIRFAEAVAVLSGALGGFTIDTCDTFEPYDLLDYTVLAALLDAAIELYIIDEHVVNLQEAYLERSVIVVNSYQNTELVITNASGSGNIILVADGGDSFLLSNVDTTGSIVIAQTPHSANVTFSNSIVPEVLVLNCDAYVSLINRTNIDSITLRTTTVVNTTLLTNPRLAPNVSIYSSSSTLNGGFHTVRNHAEGLIFLSGHITNLYSNYNLVIIGDGEILTSHIANNSTFHMIGPLAEAPMDFYAALAAFGDGLQEQFDGIIAMLTDPSSAFWRMLAGQWPVQPNAMPPATIPPVVTPPSGPSHPTSTPIQDFTMTFVAPTVSRDNIPTGLHFLLHGNSTAQAHVEHNDTPGGLFSGNVQWIPSLINNQFDETVAYTARITLTARENYHFPPFATPFGNGLTIWGSSHDHQVIQIEQSSTTMVFYLSFDQLVTNTPPNGSNGTNVCDDCGNSYKSAVVGTEPQLLTTCVSGTRRFVYTANFPALADIQFVLITQYPVGDNVVWTHAFQYAHASRLLFNIETNGFCTANYADAPIGYYWVYIVDLSNNATRVGQMQLRIHG